jgi:hypothetical protein
MDLDSNAMGDVAKNSARISSTCAKNAIIPLPFIPIIQICPIDMAIENTLLILSVVTGVLNPHNQYNIY